VTSDVHPPPPRLEALEAYLPEYEFVERHSIAVSAAPERVDAALREIYLEDLPLVRLLFRLRALGGRTPSRRPFLRLGLPLVDVPGEGLVLGLTGQFWRLRGLSTPRPATSAAFLAYDRLDVCKAVIDFRIGDGRLTTETRVHVADPGSRRKFARYWRVIRPFSGLTRIAVLRAVRRRAEEGQ
jgi:hypothetical protein